MIVITIIATLSAVAFFSYIQFSKKSRDTLRLSNVKEIQG
jgi:Tfp pilus assembly protein PilE